MKNVTIVGAGLVGSLLAVFFAKRGYKVKVFERRDDLRKFDISAGKSINLALSDRGWRALEVVGIADRIKEVAIPMYGRRMHAVDGKLTYQPYGKEGQAIYSVSRGGLNAKLMEIAEEFGEVEIVFNEKCIDVDLNSCKLTFENTKTGKTTHWESDLVFGADGAFSAVRYQMQKMDRFDYSQTYLKHGYKEMLLPANADGSYKLDKNSLHIWPRGNYMLIALANEDGSFTCTLFLPWEGPNSFENLSSDDNVRKFFKAEFPDFYDMMPDVAAEYKRHPTSSLAIIRCFPWTNKNNIALIGDAAHAIVPFYGQGMNCGFEDCTVLSQLMDKHQENWTEILKEYELLRKPDGDAIADLALRNFIEMRDLVGDSKFLLQKKIEGKIHEKHPQKWLPLYSQVTFSHIRYSEALKAGEEQDKIMAEVMGINGIEQKWDSDEVEQLILSKLK